MTDIPDCVVGGNMDRKMKISQEEIKKILEYLETIQYGSVTVVVQDGKIIQIDKNEKIRLR